MWRVVELEVDEDKVAVLRVRKDRLSPPRAGLLHIST